MQWDPQLYGAFSDHRRRPFDDLLARVGETEPGWVVDLGCGSGELTAELAQRWPAAEVLGLDSSPEMIARAETLAGPGNLAFARADIRGWTPSSGPGVVLSNAALQWVPDHGDLLRRWAGGLHPGSWLAVQVPGNFRSPSHALMRELADSPRWQGRLAGVLRHGNAVSEPAEYLETLAGNGMLADVWETTYQHVLSGADPVLEWVRGTGLRPVLAALEPDEQQEFEQAYAALLRESYPASEAGTTAFPFRRIFAVGLKL